MTMNNRIDKKITSSSPAVGSAWDAVKRDVTWFARCVPVALVSAAAATLNGAIVPEIVFGSAAAVFGIASVSLAARIVGTLQNIPDSSESAWDTVKRDVSWLGVSSTTGLVSVGVATLALVNGAHVSEIVFGGSAVAFGIAARVRASRIAGTLQNISGSPKP
jgi:hypothetical protein